ncbi:MAG: histidinol-phosphate transaminase [Flexilinea sp.]|nr:histidinol-phosphate transaminase [Flexilinea sp.]
MSRFFSEKYKDLKAYVPGEQPRDQQYIKLNTNESPFPPHPDVAEAVRQESSRLRLYSDPECTELRKILAERLGLEPDMLLMTNGSDEILNFAFMAFCDQNTPAIFPDLTYGFYPVFAQINQLPWKEIPLQPDFSIRIGDYFRAAGTVFIANPNAPTGVALSRDEIEQILRENPDHVVVVDEAYVDFGAESCLPLLRKYDNLLVVQTFSKSRSLAGGRLGFGAGSPELIRDLNTVKYSTNPYNVNRLTAAAGIACLQQDEYNRENCRVIMENRAWSVEKLKELGFEMTDSLSNFLFARHPKISGEVLYRKLKERGILIRHFTLPQISDYNRITIGTKEQMECLVRTIKEILEEKSA